MTSLHHHVTLLLHHAILTKLDVNKCTVFIELLKLLFDFASALILIISGSLLLYQQNQSQIETKERKRLEKRLRLAEDSLKRLDHALRDSGLKVSIEIEADVTTLKCKLSFLYTGTLYAGFLSLT